MDLAMIYPDSSSEKGISKYSSELIKNLKKRKLNVDEIKFISGKPLTLVKKLREIKNQEIIHFQHEYNLLGWFGLPYFLFLPYIKFIKRKKVVVTMHTVLSLQEKFRGSKIKTFLRKILYRVQNRWINWNSDKIVVHAKRFKEILSKEYNTPNEDISVLPHGIIEDVKIPSKTKSRKELKLSGNVYLLIGTMVPDHGYDIIIKQADKIGKTILVATNPSKINDRNELRIKNFLNLLKKTVKENKFEKFIRFDLKEIPYNLWWKYFSAADLIILPYRGGIGSGLFADAMAAETPVVASNVSYFKEFSEEYGCVEIAKKDDNFPETIKRAMKPKKYNAMKKECKRFLKENGLTQMSKKYKKLYGSL